MQFLLFNAKLLFVKAQYSEGVSLCETYSNRVEVLSLLLSAYYLDLPSVDDLSSIDNIRYSVTYAYMHSLTHTWILMWISSDMVYRSKVNQCVNVDFIVISVW